MQKPILVILFFLLYLSQGFAGLFGEHKHIGDEAFKRFIVKNHLEKLFTDTLGFVTFGKRIHHPYTSPLLLHNDSGSIAILVPPDSNEGISYGDLTGMSGDHSVEPMQLYEALLNASLFRHDQWGTIEQSILTNLNKHLAGINDGNKEASIFSLDRWLGNILLAYEDKSHFYRPGKTLEQQLAYADSDFIYLLGKYVRDTSYRTIFIEKLLNANNPTKYFALHLIALREMRHAGNLRVTPDLPKSIYKRSFFLGLLFNAFADHYLQDAFASGHLVVNRSSGDLIKGLNENAIHNYYNRVGLRVHNSLGEEWVTHGDNFYDLDDSTTYSHAIATDILSLEELLTEFHDAQQAQTKLLDSGKSSFSLYDSLIFDSAHPPKLSFNPEIATNRFHIYQHIPVGFSQEEMDDSILYRNSRNGWFGRASINYGAVKALHGTAIEEYLGWGLGYNLTYPASIDPSQETKLWIGIDLPSLRYTNIEANHWFSFEYGGLQCILNDRYVIEGNAGSQLYQGCLHTLYSTSIGYEIKPVFSPYAFLLKANGTFSKFNTFTIQLEFRHY